MLNRERLLVLWRRLAYTVNLPPIASLVDSATISQWNVQGLPDNELSVQNSMVVTLATRYPLFVDPQGQGRSWIISRQRVNDLQVIIATVTPVDTLTIAGILDHKNIS